MALVKPLTAVVLGRRDGVRSDARESSAVRSTDSTTIVIITLILSSVGRAAPPSAPDPAWPILEWKKATSSPFARVESPTAFIINKVYLFGGFTDELQASNQLDLYDPSSDT